MKKRDGVLAVAAAVIILLLLAAVVKLHYTEDDAWEELLALDMYWLGVLNKIKKRGVEDIMIVSVDGLSGLGDAIHAVFPKAEIQRCIGSSDPLLD